MDDTDETDGDTAEEAGMRKHAKRAKVSIKQNARSRQRTSNQNRKGVRVWVGGWVGECVCVCARACVGVWVGACVLGCLGCGVHVCREQVWVLVKLQIRIILLFLFPPAVKADESFPLVLPCLSASSDLSSKGHL